VHRTHETEAIILLAFSSVYAVNRRLCDSTNRAHGDYTCL